MLVPFNSSHSTFASVFSQPFFPFSPVFIFGIQACGRTRTGSLVFCRINWWRTQAIIWMDTWIILLFRLGDAAFHARCTRVRTILLTPLSWKKQLRNIFILPTEQRNSWKILLPTEQHSSWKILLPTEQRSSWKILLPTEQRSSWKILLPTEQHNSWKILLPTEQHSSWKILLPTEQRSG